MNQFTLRGLAAIGVVSLLILNFQNCAQPNQINPLDLASADPSSLTCRPGFWSLADGRICMESTIRTASSVNGSNATSNASTTNAIHICKGVGPGSRICTHNDFQQACGSMAATSGVSPSTDPYSGLNIGVYGDHSSISISQSASDANGGGAGTLTPATSAGNMDDVYLTWNGAQCGDNNDGAGRHETVTTTFAFRCCY